MANILNCCVIFFIKFESNEKIIEKSSTPVYWWIVPIKKIWKNYKGSNLSSIRKKEIF